MCVVTYAQVRVDGGIAGSARQVLVLTVGDVLVRAGVSVLLGQTEVNDVNKIAFLPQTHKEVIRFHIPVDEVFGVDVLYSADLRTVAQKRNA